MLGLVHIAVPVEAQLRQEAVGVAENRECHGALLVRGEYAQGIPGEPGVVAEAGSEAGQRHVHRLDVRHIEMHGTQPGGGVGDYQRVSLCQGAEACSEDQQDAKEGEFGFHSNQR